MSGGSDRACPPAASASVRPPRAAVCPPHGQTHRGCPWWGVTWGQAQGVCAAGEAAGLWGHTCAHTHTRRRGVAGTRPRPVPPADWPGVGSCGSRSRDVHTRSSVFGGRKGRVFPSLCPLPHPHTKYPQGHVPVAGRGPQGGLGPTDGRIDSQGPRRVCEPRGVGEALPARKPLRRCPHYITDIPATRPGSLQRGDSPSAEQGPAPSGLQRAGAATLPSGGAQSRGNGRFQTPRGGQCLVRGEGGQRGAWEGARAGRQRARG